MAQSFLSTLSPILVLFSCILIGYLLNKLKLVPDNTATVLSGLEKYIFLPAMGFSTFSQYCTVESISQNINIVTYGVIATALAACLAIFLSRFFERQDIDKRNVYRYSLMFANHGFMGCAIVPVILGGQAHLYKYLLLTLPLHCMTYLWGVNILLTPKAYRKNQGFKVLVNPPIIGFALGILVGILGIKQYIPAFLISSVDSLQSCMGPVAMILTGFVVADYPFGELFSDKKVYAATGLRLLILPAVIIGVLVFLGAERYIAALALFAFATPLGLNTVVFPAAYGGDTKTGAGMAMISHLLGVVTIPLMYGLLQLVL